MQPIAIACGDPAGIGPEIAWKALARLQGSETSARYVLLGDRQLLETWRRRVAPGLPVPEDGVEGDSGLGWQDPRSEALGRAVAPRSAEAGEAALAYLKRGAEGCLRGEFAALVTAPLCKEAVAHTGIGFRGQTEYLADLAGAPEVTMLLLGDDREGRWLRVALATTHLPLRQVADALCREDVERAIRHSAEACMTLGLERSRVAVCGLNPHAGEGGWLGMEETTVIAPAVEAARTRGMNVVGPLSGDTVFGAALQGAYDVVVAMYHDQGLAPLKTVAMERGVNWTLGLPFPRTSPDHGTAYDLAGKGVADEGSMVAAIRLALRLAKRGRAS